MTPPAIPGATYRLQFNRDFTFADACRIVPYLQRLGITHVYASPFLKARAGSPHGYDIVDHNSLNPEIGDTAGFNDYVRTLQQHGMGLLLDIVPNHMGVGGDDNAWWLDVLENGEASRYAPYFDIDWHPVNPVLYNRVLLPFLGDHYGAVLERGELKPLFAPAQGAFGVRYHEHLFPLDPRTYPQILETVHHELAREVGAAHAAVRQLAAIAADCKSLPRRTALSTPRRIQRREGGAACKRRLAELCRERAELRAAIEHAVARLGGTADVPASFDALHRLLEAQAYRLAYWRVATDEINYRRFFDINELAGIRMDNSAVFDATHRMVGRLLADNQVQGLRIDHPDGLSDPDDYFHRLQQLMQPADAADAQVTTRYLLIEKILARHEHLPADWPVAGTTGYEFAHLVNGLFIYPGSEGRLSRLYARYTRQAEDFEQVLYACRKLIIHSTLSSELSALANLASRIAASNRHTRDFTYHRLREALAELVAGFPVYRTYITRRGDSQQDRRYRQWAIEQAKQRSPAVDIEVFDFLNGLLAPPRDGQRGARLQHRQEQFIQRFQQYTAPVMAKGLEDTACYVYNRLVSLNDVGFDPRSFGISISAFHHENRRRLADWPHAMVSTATHDSKRGEDVRARINVLSELPGEWRQHLLRWLRVNHGKKRLVGGLRSPSRNDEYLLYQTLIGAWPLAPLDTAGLDAFRERIEAYMLKAIREAKQCTSWINPDLDYEEAMRHFVHTLLDDPERNPFLADFLPFQQHIAGFGLLNSLSQLLLKLTVPGVPDIYQGNELWAFNLVDPDNRRAVDYHRREEMLRVLADACRDSSNLPALLCELREAIADGRAKLYLTWKTLSLRREHPGLFAEGRYLALDTEGPGADQLCAFCRCSEDTEVLVVAPRWTALCASGSSEPWPDTWIRCPQAAPAADYCSVLSGRGVQARTRQDGLWLNAAELLEAFPVALLLRTGAMSGGTVQAPADG
jgi:(1->4)-alpha-D-glucan 1-alpha-D-glucosylmutase